MTNKSQNHHRHNLGDHGATTNTATAAAAATAPVPVITVV
jgi:hypothetical protein